MVISPPFLPEPSQTNTPQVAVDTTMQGGQHGAGAYPVSLNGWWHGGMHLHCALPVRAIADGTVHYIRKPAAKPSHPTKDDPLNYNGGWTSNGVIVIKHETEIGEDATLTWYSVYMHLRDVDQELAQGEPIWRKDKLGHAGWIYGRNDLIHFEIVMEDDDLKTLLGRDHGTPFDTDASGRTDAVWGTCYVHLPADIKAYTQDMRQAQRTARAAHGTEQAQAQAAYLTAQAGGSTLGSNLVVGIAYHEGTCSLTSHHPEGGTLGASLNEGGNYEYDLYEEAVALYPDSPQAGYQLLRFGRVLNDATLPADSAHWRRIRLPDGSEGWVNLNAAGVAACSDADFPPWCGWVVAGDDDNGHIRCNSATIKHIVLRDEDQTLPVNQFVPRLQLDAVRKKLARTICKMPSDWDISRREQIWHEWQHNQDLEIGYLPPAAKEAQDKAWKRLAAHCEALCFWTKAKLPEPAWHLPPKAFIKQMQKCGWLSKNEMVQMFPPTAMRKSSGQWVSETVFPQHIGNYYVDLNKAARWYGIVTPSRMAAFYANAMQETMWFGTLHENNSSTRYWPWDGRGFLQLTWPDNYIKYWRFIGKQVDAALAHDLSVAQGRADRERTNASLVALEAKVTATIRGWRSSVADTVHPATAADSASVYWTWSKAAQNADQVDTNVYAAKSVDNIQHVYYKNTPFGRVAATVNVGQPSANFNAVNGIVARFQAYTACQMTLFDVTSFPNSQGDVSSAPAGYQLRRP